MSSGVRLRNYIYKESLLRLVLLLVFLVTEWSTPFFRIIQDEEWWLYKFPTKTMAADLLPTSRLFTLVVLCPLAVVSGRYLKNINKQKYGETAKLDLMAGILSASLTMGMNGIATNLIKNRYGRPRPDFFFRCFPDGNPPPGQPNPYNLECTGNYDDIIEGRKSFPSGHSSFLFSFCVWISLYLAGKLRVANSISEGGRLPRSENLIICLTLPLLAVLNAIGRTCDYKHHWQDVTCGSLLGTLMAWIGYRRFFPAISDRRSAVSYMEQKALQFDENQIYDLGKLSVETSSI